MATGEDLLRILVQQLEAALGAARMLLEQVDAPEPDPEPPGIVTMGVPEE
jgi:hypothetical protein